MRAVIEKGYASGKVQAPTSKSVAHRLMISAAMCDGESFISGITPCEDVLATADCITALGASVTARNGGYAIRGTDMRRAAAEKNALNSRESGSTLRFMIPIAALSGSSATLVGSERLLERPLSVYSKIFNKRSLEFNVSGDGITLKGPLTSGEYELPGNVSSQFITGLLFALPVLFGDSVIKITPPFESAAYVDLTIKALGDFGVRAYFDGPYTIKIPGGQKYQPTDLTVEGDYSGAANLEALNALGSDIEILGLDPNSAQADRAYLEIIPKIKEGTPDIDISGCPDLAPILFALAAYFGGATFRGTSRLKIKESDRAQTMAEELRKLGAKICVLENSVIIEKATLHAPTEPLCGHNDHRVVMALTVLLTRFGGEIEGAEAITKSYPDFFSDISSLGIGVTLYE